MVSFHFAVSGSELIKVCTFIVCVSAAYRYFVILKLNSTEKKFISAAFRNGRPVRVKVKFRSAQPHI
jgi:hypothetical protein